MNRVFNVRIIGGILSAALIGGFVCLVLAFVGLFLPFAGWTPARQLAPELYLDVIKVVGAGFIVALLGAVIPHVLQESRDQFERFRKSRLAYSKAKTAVMYLPQRITQGDAQEALGLIRDAHEKLHLAETYPEELQKHLSSWWPSGRTAWVSRNYWELMAVGKVLESNIVRWSTLPPEKRLKLLREALDIVQVAFGRDGKRWGEASEQSREEELEKQLDSSVDPRDANRSS